jgi:hypothetical protein
MRRNQNRIRPELEGLESMTLLSGAAAAIHAHVATMTPIVNPLPPISISGRAHGQYFARTENPDTGATYDFAATGNISPLGQSLIAGELKTVGNINGNGPVTTIRIMGRHGALKLRVAELNPNLPPPPGSSTAANVVHFAFTVTGGNGRYRNDQGSGTLDVRFNGEFAGFESIGAGSLDMAFHPSPPPLSV